MSSDEHLATADYVTIVVGEKLPQQYDSDAIVQLARSIGADILTVGDSGEILPNGDETDCYVGALDSNLDAIHSADGFLIVGVGIPAAKDIPWSVFSGDGIIMTDRSIDVSLDAVGGGVDCMWYCNADANTLQELTTDVIESVGIPTPSTIYTAQDQHPSLPAVPGSRIDSSDQVKQCQVYHVLTNNKVAIGNRYPGPAIEWRCPAVAHRNHGRLERLTERRNFLERRERLYDKTSESGKRALERVQKRREQLTDQIEELREWFDGRFDDVIASDPTLSNVEQFDPQELKYK